jgi:hypothetical protein
MVFIKKTVALLILIIPWAVYADNDVDENWKFNNQNSYLERYPERETEFTEFYSIIEQACDYVIRREYMSASKLIRNEICKYEMDTNDLGELTLLFMLLKFDAAIDYFLLNDKRSGANKNYIMSYIGSRLDEYESNSLIPNQKSWFTAIAFSSVLLYSGYGGDTYWKFKFYITSFLYWLPYKHTDYPESEWEYLAIEYTVMPEYVFIFRGMVTYGLLYDSLVENLFIMSEYKEDIQLYCGSDERLWRQCLLALNLLGMDIPIVDSGDDFIVWIIVTYRRARAVDFFSRYYR